MLIYISPFFQNSLTNNIILGIQQSYPDELCLLQKYLKLECAVAEAYQFYCIFFYMWEYV